MPYALNVDRERGKVWVNGNQSDTILGFDIASESWKVYPMPRQRFFTRDIEISEGGWRHLYHQLPFPDLAVGRWGAHAAAHYAAGTIVRADHAHTHQQIYDACSARYNALAAQRVTRG